MKNYADSISSQVRVLVVDDHPTTASTLARAISQTWPEIDVISATGGNDALEQVRDDAVDLIITDMMMPDMNGLELIEKLQTHPGGRPVHTVLITAYDVPGLKETARRLKVDETIVKPVRPERICQIVGRVLDELDHAGAPGRFTEAQATYKILIADDVSDNVALLSRYLQKEGYVLVTASNGIETLNKARSEMPDLILLDVNMPGKDGFEVLQEIRVDPATQYIPVIILTAARLEPGDMQYGLNLGADDYVTKPFDRRELLARIHTKLRAKEAEEFNRRRYKGLSVLPEIGREFSARLDIDDLTDVALRRSVETLGAMFGHLILFGPNGSIRKTYAVAGPPASKLELLNLDTLTRQVHESQRCLIVKDTRSDERLKFSPDDPGHSALLVPLMGRANSIGMLLLIHERAGYFTVEHQLLLQAIASQASIALETAQLVAGQAGPSQSIQQDIS